MAHKIFVRSLITKSADSIPLDGTLELPEFQVGSLDYTVAGPARFSGSVDFVGEGVRAHGRVSILLGATCVRCLTEFPLSVSGSFDTIFYTDPQVDEEGDALPVISNPEDEIDLEPILVEALVVETPFAPLHHPECAGICSGCGVDLNEVECECGDEPDPDHPLAALRSLIVTPEDGAEN